jgi:predicted ATPase
MPATLSTPLPAADPADPGAPRLAGVWQVRVLGGLEARNGDVVLTHFVSHAIAALLARLALFPRRQHPREELVELLWPGVDIDVGRNRLRHALSTLKRLLEPPGVEPGSVLAADRRGVQLAPGAMACDALDFERCVRERRHADARRLYRGELLPGYYEDWVQDERARLIALHDRLGDDLAAPLAPEPAPPAGPPTLPGYLTSCLGRDADGARLAGLVAEHRLITLTGAGGCGKTRLAVEVARAAAGFDCVCFAALADCAAPGEAASQLRAALQLPLGSGDPLDQAVTMLATCRPLIVLDNFEQLVQAGGPGWVETLLARVPQLHLLVTSRRVLGVAGEREFALEPLAWPEPRAGLEEVARCASVALFVDRARAVRPEFRLTEQNQEAVAALCRALDGLPLAIELAASRSRAFSPRDMLAALSERFTWLARPAARGAERPLRHDSLRAAIDWSWQLLAPREQRFLLALSVFRGGWSAAAAQAVCEEPDAHALLEVLTADSLLRSDTDAGGAMRFFMLDMIREFLRERLAPEAALRLRRQHRAHCLATALGLQARGVLTVDEAELPNFHEALRSAVDDADHALALTLALALRSQWESHGISPEGLALLQRALDGAAPEGVDAGAVQGCILVALLSIAAGQGAAAQRYAERALRHAGEVPALRAAALCAFARIALERHLHRDGLMEEIDRAMALAEQAGAGDLAAQALSLKGMLTLHGGKDPARADALIAQAHDRYLMLGLPREAGLLLYERTICLYELGRFADALAQARLFEQECVAAGDRNRQLKAINLQGVLQARLRRWGDAVASYRRCAELAWRCHNHYWLGYALWNHGRNLARLREPERAALLTAFSGQHWRTHFGPLDQRDLHYERQVRALVEHQVGGARAAALWAEGSALSLARAVELALRPAGH